MTSPLTSRMRSRSLFQDSDLSTDSGATSDSEIDVENEDSDEDAPVTASNFAARSRALDAQAAREAQLDEEELQMAAQANADEFAGIEDMDEDEEEVDEPGAEDFVLPTAEEREEEKKAGGPEVHVVQKRMRECVRILKRWKISQVNTGRFVFWSVSDAVVVMIC
jgi:25S rRNA (cytosine2870-C5)-methyltransferase